MAFTVIPAIDLMEGQVVRLEQGRRDRRTVYSSNPVEVARRWEDAGATRLHVVDLDGAFEGQPGNLDAVAAIREAVSMEVELGGGIRHPETIRRALATGVDKVVLGTRAFEDETFLREQLQELGGRLIVGVDARDGRVSVRGWVEVAESRAVDFVKRLESLGMREVIFTDVATDGMLTGPNLAALREVALAAPGVGIIASGGIARLEDLEAVAALRLPNLVGAITGKALYSGAIDLAEAVRRTRNSQETN
jgi:phosphoribosylformimino-5-aminoimidazole carboxamide ribotide isomerase